MISSNLNSTIFEISFSFTFFFKSSFGISTSNTFDSSAKSENADTYSIFTLSASLIDVWRYAAISLVTKPEPNGITLEWIK